MFCASAPEQSGGDWFGGLVERCRCECMMSPDKICSVGRRLGYQPSPGAYAMRMATDIDDELLTRAAALTGMDDQVALIRCALELLLRTESGRQLCALGGSDRDAVAAPHRRVGCLWV